MLAHVVIAALLIATETVQESFENFETQEEVVFYEDENQEEVALSEEESEYQDLVFFEDESEIADELLADEEL